MEYRAVIKFFVTEGLKRNEIHSKFIKFMGTLLLRFQQLRNGLLSLNVAVPALQMIHVKDVQKYNTRNHWTSARYGIGWPADKSAWYCWDYGHLKRTCRIHFAWRLDIKNLCARWCRACSQQIKNALAWKSLNSAWSVLTKLKLILCVDFFTVIETWIHHYTPESKQQTKLWTEAGCSAPKMTRSVPSARKFMASVFWDAESILFIDYLERGTTITGEYYSNLLTRLDEKLVRKDPVCKRKKKSAFIRTRHPPTKVFWQREN